MTTTNLGRIAVVPKGNWSAGTYKALDLVRYNGSSYIAKATTTALPTDTSYWTLVVSDGATGSTGPTGNTGATGPAGDTYYTWIKYADDAYGTNLTDIPTGKSYIGIAVNKTSATESTTASDYAWSLIKGLDGTGTVNSVAALTLTTIGTDLTSTVADGSTTPVITLNVPNASASARGVLSATDWSTFNGKQAAISFGTGVQTFITTPSSANLAAAITDETGTGALVFAISPTLVTPILGTPTSGVLTNCTGYTYANLSGTVPTWNQNTTGTAANLSGTPTLPSGITLSASTLGGNLTGGDYSLTRTMYKDTGWVYYNSSTVAALDFTNGSQQRWTPTISSNPTLSITNWPPSGNLGELLIEGVNLGAAGPITWPTINWITSTGATTTTFASNGVTLQTSGTDWCLLWTRDAGTTIYGKFVR